MDILEDIAFRKTLGYAANISFGRKRGMVMAELLVACTCGLDDPNRAS